MPRTGRRRRPTVDQQLDDVYARVPSPDCKGLCQYSCSSVAMTPLEQQRIAARHGIELPLADAAAARTDRTALGVEVEGRCIALNDTGRCKVYVDRPLVCRLWGAVEQMRCEYGCEPVGGMIPPRAAGLAMARVRELSERAARQ